MVLFDATRMHHDLEPSAIVPLSDVLVGAGRATRLNAWHAVCTVNGDQGERVGAQPPCPFHGAQGSG
jgi:hypothetical protein